VETQSQQKKNGYLGKKRVALIRVRKKNGGKKTVEKRPRERVETAPVYIDMEGDEGDVHPTVDRQETCT